MPDLLGNEQQPGSDRAVVPVGGLVCDLDGVIYRGEQAVPGAREALDALAGAGVPVVFCTNHSRLTVEQYRERLAGFGIDAGADRIVTSAVATGDALHARGMSGARAMVIGQDGVLEALAAAGIAVEEDPARVDVDLVVVGWDDRFDYHSMRRAATAVRAGAAFVATNDDATLPRGDSLWPGTGAICAAIKVASGREPEVIGKPHRGMMEAAQRRLGGATPVAIIGDNPHSDLAGGRLMGWTTVLVLSGVTDRAAAASLSPPPDLTLESIADLPGHVARAREGGTDGGR